MRTLGGEGLTPPVFCILLSLSKQSIYPLTLAHIDHKIRQAAYIDSEIRMQTPINYVR